MIRPFVCAVVGATALGALPTSATAEEPKPEFKAAAQKDDLPPIRFGAAPGQGATIETKDGKFALNLRARIQIRDTFTHDEKGDTNEINIKTMRLWFTGHALVPELRYGIQLAFGTNDFEKDNASPLFDAFAEYVGIRDLNLRVGQFFVPFDRGRTPRFERRAARQVRACRTAVQASSGGSGGLPALRLMQRTMSLPWGRPQRRRERTKKRLCVLRASAVFSLWPACEGMRAPESQSERGVRCYRVWC